MKKRNNCKEFRKHLRVKMRNTVIGILSSKEPESVGTITDISLGGVKCTYRELRTEPSKISSCHSIDLIAGSHYVIEIPCKYVWDGAVETKSNSQLTMIRQCGIQFGKLAPKQVYLLSKFIDICVSEGIRSSPPRPPITVKEEQPLYLSFLEKNEESF